MKVCFPYANKGMYRLVEDGDRNKERNSRGAKEADPKNARSEGMQGDMNTHTYHSRDIESQNISSVGEMKPNEMERPT